MRRKGDLLGGCRSACLDFLFKGGRQLGVLHQILFRLFATLSERVFAMAEVSASLFDDAEADSRIQDVSFLGDALGVKDIELRLAERGSDLVFHDFDACFISHDLLGIAGFPNRFLQDLVDAADIEAQGAVELQRISSGRRFGVSDTDAHHTAN